MAPPLARSVTTSCPTVFSRSKDITPADHAYFTASSRPCDTSHRPPILARVEAGRATKADGPLRARLAPSSAGADDERGREVGEPEPPVVHDRHRDDGRRFRLLPDQVRHDVDRVDITRGDLGGARLPRPERS